MKKAAAFLAVVFAVLLTQGIVYAHAIPLACLPRFGFSTSQPPPQLICQFSESLNPDNISLTVTAPNGARVDKNDTRFYDGDNHTLVVSLDTAAMPQGIYTVNWKVEDTIDAGETSGVFQFGVNTVVPPTPTPVLPGVPMTPVLTPQPPANTTGDLISRFLIGVGIVMLLAVGIVYWRSRATITQDSESDME